MLIDYYKELEISKSWSLEEIQDYLQKEKRKWDNRAARSNDLAYQQKRIWISEAQEIFSSAEKKKAYDTQLEKSEKKTSDPADERSEKFDFYFKKAEDYYLNKQQYDLAEQAVKKALQFRNETNTGILRLAAVIYANVGKIDLAMNYVNEAIVEEDGVEDILYNHYTKYDVYFQRALFMLKENQYGNRQFVIEAFEQLTIAYNYEMLYVVKDISSRIAAFDRVIREINLLKQNTITSPFLNTVYVGDFIYQVIKEYSDCIIKNKKRDYYNHVIQIYQWMVDENIINNSVTPSTLLYDICRQILNISPQHQLAMEVLDKKKRAELEAERQEKNRIAKIERDKYIQKTKKKIETTYSDWMEDLDREYNAKSEEYTNNNTKLNKRAIHDYTLEISISIILLFITMSLDYGRDAGASSHYSGTKFLIFCLVSYWVYFLIVKPIRLKSTLKDITNDMQNNRKKKADLEAEKIRKIIELENS